MSDDAKKTMTDAANTMKTGAENAQAMGSKAMTDAATTMKTGAENAQNMGRQMMEKSMSGMAEFTKLFSDMKMPGMSGMGNVGAMGGMGGMEMVLSMQRRNMEVLSAANRVAIEGAQAVARRHMEIMQQTMTEMTEGMRDMASPDSPQVKAAKQAEMLKVSYERAVAHIRELADLIQRSSGEAVEMLNQRFAEALDEVKKLAAQGAAKGPTA